MSLLDTITIVIRANDAYSSRLQAMENSTARLGKASKRAQEQAESFFNSSVRNSTRASEALAEYQRRSARATELERQGRIKVGLGQNREAQPFFQRADALQISAQKKLRTSQEYSAASQVYLNKALSSEAQAAALQTEEAAAAEAMGGSVTNLRLRTMALYGGALLAGIGVLSLGKAALETAADFDRMTASISALNKGNDALAGKKVEFLSNYALTSSGDIKDIVNAGTTLEAFGLNSTYWIKTIAQTASAHGGATAERLDMLARSLGRIYDAAKRGDKLNVGRGMRSLQGFGVSEKQIHALGVEFEEGRAKGVTPEQYLMKVKQVLDSTFGMMDKKLKGSLPIALSNLGDLGTRALQKLGEGISRGGFLNMLNKMNDSLLRIVKSDVLINWGKTIFFAFNLVGQALLAVGNALFWVGNLLHALAIPIAVIGGIAAFVTAIKDAAFWMGVLRMLAYKTFAIEVWNAFVAVGGKIVQAVKAIAGAWKLVTSQEARAAAIETFIVALAGGWAKIAAAAGAAALVAGGLYLGFGPLMNFAEKKLGLDGIDKDPFNGLQPPSEEGGDEDSSNLDDISKNTQRTADNTDKLADMKRFTIGGGVLGGIGVTPVEFRGSMHRRVAAARSGSIQVNAGDQKLSDAITDIVQQVVWELQQNGLVPLPLDMVS